MNPIHTIGRHTLPIGSVVSINREGGLLGLIRWALMLGPTYRVLLTDGHKIHFNEAEKKEYDRLIEMHGVTMQWYGMALGAGLRPTSGKVS